MNVTRLFAPSGVRIDLTDEETSRLMWALQNTNFTVLLLDAIDAAYYGPNESLQPWERQP